jgi:hypothetical protein
MVNVRTAKDTVTAHCVNLQVAAQAKREHSLQGSKTLWWNNGLQEH